MTEQLHFICQWEPLQITFSKDEPTNAYIVGIVNWQHAWKIYLWSVEKFDYDFSKSNPPISVYALLHLWQIKVPTGIKIWLYPPV